MLLESDFFYIYAYLHLYNNFTNKNRVKQYLKIFISENKIKKKKRNFSHQKYMLQFNVFVNCLYLCWFQNVIRLFYFIYTRYLYKTI